MSKNAERELKKRFQETTSVEGIPASISALIVTEFPGANGDPFYYITQISSVKNEPCGVRIIWDNKLSTDPDSKQKLKDYLETQVKGELLQADRKFMALTNARKTGAGDYKCDAYLTPDHILFYAENSETGALNINNELTTDDRKSIRNFLDELSLTLPDEWLEFRTLDNNTVHLNRYQDIAHLSAHEETLEISFASAKGLTPATAQFSVQNADVIAKQIAEKMRVLETSTTTLEVRQATPQ